jgi:hypothetical protein
MCEQPSRTMNWLPKLLELESLSIEPRSVTLSSSFG